jgi:hypothetical protein
MSAVTSALLAGEHPILFVGDMRIVVKGTQQLGIEHDSKKPC